MSAPSGTLAPDSAKTESHLHPLILLPTVLSLAIAQTEAEETQLEATSGDSVGGLGTASCYMYVRDQLEGPVKPGRGGGCRTEGASFSHAAGFRLPHHSH